MKATKAAATAAVRAARCAPLLTLDQVADTAKVSKRALRERMRALTQRGRCHGIAVELSKSGRSVGERAAAAGDHRRPVWLARIAAEDSSPQVTGALSGTAGWATRSVVTSKTPRWALVRARNNYGDPRTSLAKLAQCPPQLLAGLASSYHNATIRLQDVAENPACPSWLLAELSSWDEQWGRVSIAVRADCPVAVLASFAGEPNSALLINTFSNPRLPERFVNNATDNLDPQVRQAVARRSTTAEVLQQMGADPDVKVRQRTAQNPHCPHSLAQQLLEDPHPAVRAAAAAHRDCGPATLLRLCADPDPGVRAAATAHRACPDSPIKTLTGWINHTDPDVRAAAAARVDLPAEAVRVMTQDPDPAVRAVAAAHDGCDSVTLLRLCGDKDPKVRTVAAAHRACPDSPLKAFGVHANRPDTESRIAAARRRDCPPQMLVALLHDPENAVSAAAASNPALPTQAALAAAAERHTSSAARAEIAKRGDCPPSVLAQLAKDGRYASAVLRAVAANPNTPTETVVAMVATNHDTDARVAVASNPACDQRHLTELATDDAPAVVVAVARRADCTAETLTTLAQHPEPSVRAAVAANAAVGQAKLEALGADPEPSVRAAVAANAAVGQAKLEALGADPEPSVRAAVAARADCPAQTLAELTADTAPAVIAAVVANPAIALPALTNPNT